MKEIYEWLVSQGFSKEEAKKYIRSLKIQNGLENGKKEFYKYWAKRFLNG